ncbi:hypothetical protein [Streptomyces gobiensis]|uniref:hypothetical protein n=1 Tax=Streptomyces gobiensis TaxID=2875706 RepID=UPI001E3AF2AE|nr:hypothetical protein [Streptomyces gobiensis]UGY94102.1 hypothetical protein test1122_21870 [Streptomyces gobiensis]
MGTRAGRGLPLAIYLPEASLVYPTHDQFGYAREPDGTHHAWHIPADHRWDLRKLT